MINRALLANQRAVAKLFFNLMKSEMKRELSLQLKWRDRVKDWRLIRKNCIIQSFRSEVWQQVVFWSMNSTKWPVFLRVFYKKYFSIFFPNETKNPVFLFSIGTHRIHFVLFQAFLFSQHVITSVCPSILQRLYGKGRNTESPNGENREGKYDEWSDSA